MRIVSIVGARPQIIKSAALIPKLKKISKVTTIHTGQHYDFEMSKLHYNTFNLSSPKYNLGVGSGSHSLQVGKIMMKLEKFLIKEEPDIVIVYGDTNSTLASAVTAAKLFLPIAHIEAGLRLERLLTPEEINRRSVDSITSLFFPPTRFAMENLISEGHIRNNYLCGDVMADILLNSIQKDHFSIINKVYGIEKKEYNLLTIHRPVNTNSLSGIRNILLELSKSEIPILFPIHPRTRIVIEKLSKTTFNKQIKIIDPVDYITFIHLEKFSKKIITDSGGVQKEAYIQGIPCITLMNWTCWPETVKEGMNTLVGTDISKLEEAINCWEPNNVRKNLFGDGRASINITNMIREFIENK